MQKILSVNDVKVYSRKQIVAWVESSKVSSFQQLKNGLFFLKILRKLAPQQVQRYKTIQKPINQYEQTQNMNIVKKILNKHNLQLNMNVQALVTSKNCFQFANWFRNLYEQNKSDNDNDTEFHYSEKSYTPAKVIDEINVSNYKILSRATSSDKKNKGVTNIKKLGRVTSGFIGMNKDNKLGYTLKVSSPFDSELTYQLFSSNSRNNIENKSSLSSNKNIGQQIRTAKSRTKYQTQNCNWFTQNFNETTSKKSKGFEKQKLKVREKQRVLTQQQNIANMMKLSALEEQVEGIEEIIKKIQQYLVLVEPNISIDKFKKQIIQTIYKISSNEVEKLETSRIQVN